MKLRVAARVLATVSFPLAADDDIEQLSTTLASGLTAINLTGNALAQRITGNAGGNNLGGGLGNDTLTGGLGADQFIFNTALGATSFDRITDFSVADDTIVLGSAVFTGLGASLAPGDFEANTTGIATLAASRIIYDSNTGKLFFGVDGLGGVAGQQFAVITSHLSGFGAGDFAII